MNGLTPLGAADGRVVLDAERLKHLRKQLGLSQSALAERCFDQRLCVSIASIKRAETGKAVLYRTARHLAALYAIDLAEVLLGDAPPDDAAPDDTPPGAAAMPPPSRNDDELGRRRVIGLFVSGLPPAYMNTAPPWYGSSAACRQMPPRRLQQACWPCLAYRVPTAATACAACNAP